MVYARVSVLSYSYFSSLVSSPAASLLFHSNILSRSRASFSPPTRKLSVSSSLATPLNISTSPHLVQEKEESIESSHKTNSNRWKPLCLYHTQGKCTKVRSRLRLKPQLVRYLKLVFSNLRIAKNICLLEWTFQLCFDSWIPFSLSRHVGDNLG